MKVRRLKEEKHLEAFQHLADQHIGVRFPIDYLQRSRVVAYVNNEEEIVGGYVFVTRPPFRVIDSLPDDHKENCPVLKNVDLSSCFEVTGLWLDPSLRRGRSSILLWLSMYKDVVFSGKKHFVYAYCLKKQKLAQLYKVAKPQVIFRGETKVLEGMKEPAAESIEVGSTRMATLALLHSPTFLARRAFGKQRLFKKYKYMHQLQTQK